PVYVPAARPARLAPIVRVPAFVPEAGETVSHEELLVAVQLSVPAPLLEIETDCEAGFELPAVPLKLRAAAETERAGVGAAATFRVAEMVLGAPAATPARFACAVRTPAFVPEAGEIVSQD